MALPARRSRLKLVRAWVRSFRGEQSGPARSAAIIGVAWTILAFGGAQALRLGASLLSTRLLLPELFGLMAVVQAIYAGLTLFSDVGVGISIVRHPRGEQQEFLNTAWTIQVLRGLFLFGACTAAAPAAAEFYADERLLWLLPVVGFNAVLLGFSSTYIHLLRRRLAVREAALLELSAQFVGLVVLVCWAWISPSVLALASAGLTASAVTLVASHALNRRHCDRPGWHSSTAVELLRFGKWIFFSTALTFLASQSDRLLLGKLYSLDLLGVYNIAFGLAEVPRALLLAISGRVILPIFSNFTNAQRQSELASAIVLPRHRLLLVSALGLAMLVGTGDLIVKLLYDPRYDKAAWMLPILAIGIWPNFLSRSVDPILFAAGKPQWPAIGSALSFAALLGGALLGHRLGGVIGAVIGISLSSMGQYTATSVGLRREGFWFYRQDARMTLYFVLATAFILAVRVMVGSRPVLFNALGLFK